MKESQLIGTLIPPHPDFQPIIQEIGQKYQLPEVDPDGEPITEIYLDGVSARYQRAVKKADFAAREKLSNLLVNSVTLYAKKAIVQGNIPLFTDDVLIPPRERCTFDI